jgi:hypothetical protein
MPRTLLLTMCLWAGMAVCCQPLLAAPPGPADLLRSIETSRKAVADMEGIIREYDDEMRRTMANDPVSVRRREEIRILKRYYQQEIEARKAKIIEEYRKIQEMRAHGVQ